MILDVSCWCGGQTRPHKPHLPELEALAKKGARIGLHMDLLDQLGMSEDSARAWVRQFSLVVADSHPLINRVMYSTS